MTKLVKAGGADNAHCPAAILNEACELKAWLQGCGLRSGLEGRLWGGGVFRSLCSRVNA